MCRLMRYCGEFSSTLVVKGGVDQHLRLLESITSSLGESFYVKRGQKRKWDGGRCGSLSLQSGFEPFGLWGVTCLG